MMLWLLKTFLMIPFLISVASFAFATGPEPQIAIDGVYPLQISEQFNEAGVRFETCEVVVGADSSFVRTSLMTSDHWRLQAGGLRADGQAAGNIWSIEEIESQDVRKTTTITFDPQTRDVIRAEIRKTNASGHVISKYVCTVAAVS